MTKETKHTPTPWRVETDTTLIWGDCNPDDNSTRGMGYPIAECRINPSGNWSTGPYADEGDANAAHIVKCVNMHDELVEALKRQADNMAFVLNHMNTEGWYDKFISELSKDRETLKKAGAL